MCEIVTERGTQEVPIVAYKVLVKGRNPFYPSVSLGGVEEGGPSLRVHRADIGLSGIVPRTMGGIHVFRDAVSAQVYASVWSLSEPDRNVLSIVQVLVWGDYLAFQGGGAYEFATLAPEGE